MDRGASCPAHQICWLDQQLTRTGRPRSGWVQRVKVKRTRVLLCKSLTFLGEQCPKVTRIPIHLGNPGEHDREFAEQVAPALEQALLDQVLDRAWGKGR